MLLVISPAKNLDFESPAPTRRRTQPDYLDDSARLVSELKKLAPQQVSGLMGISDKLGLVNYDRYQQWQTPFTASNARQAILAFNGDVYSGLGARSFDADDFSFAQKRLRILSGLYGVLRPLDLMQAYRLEMGTRFANARGKNLYEFWGGTITEAINKQLTALQSGVLVNLASNEYFRSVQPQQLNAEVITPVFKDWKRDQYKIISFFAKQARGLMCRYAIKRRITDAAALKDFDCNGYCYNEAMSSPHQWVFVRRQ